MFGVEELIFFLSTIHTWIIIVAAGTFGFFIYHRKKFQNKFLLYSYLLFIALFLAESVRNLYIKSHGMSFWLRIPNFILGSFVISFLAYLSYYYAQKLDITQIFDMSASLESEVEEFQADVDISVLKQGFIHLVKSETPDYAFKLFREAVTNQPGACFTRKSPKKVRKLYQFEKTPITWLRDKDDVEDYNVIEAMRTNFLRETIVDFAKENDMCVILLEGIEYLLVKNSYDKVLHFLQGLSDDLSVMEGVTMIITVNPDSFGKRELALIEEEMDVILEEESES